ncbi:hypothetical protein [Pontibacter ramchanderi]|uniref:Uncharacterized protein n=1 Tax=Pontibacter ramchanderi TaxID=1179743 RepID=A0A2N3UCP4_9BACT|nr:hypothetical protein [Pontibacter ramchanderi]PKV67105.1 hypothetical protein BD749_2244 [Pontibacter ramchanderi]
MRVFLFLVLTVLVIYFGYSIFSLEFSKLSDYGFGYLVGNCILFVLAIVSAFILGKKILIQE